LQPPIIEEVHDSPTSTETKPEVKVEEVKHDTAQPNKEPSHEAKIEDVEDDADMPPLEPAQDAEEAAAGGPGKGKQSRTEKKSRKAVTKLGMKAVPGVLRIIVKKGKNVLFVINNPDVFKSPSNDSTWVVFGEAKIEDSTDEALKSTAEKFAAATDDIPDLVEVKNEPPATPVPAVSGTPEAAKAEVTVDEEGVNPKHIELVMEQTKATRAQAIKALKISGGDIVNAIMEISMGDKVLQ